MDRQRNWNRVAVLQALRDEFSFEQLTDLCGVDYSAYGQAEWEGSIRGKGFSRGVAPGCYQEGCDLPSFWVFTNGDVVFCTPENFPYEINLI